MAKNTVEESPAAKEPDSEPVNEGKWGRVTNIYRLDGRVPILRAIPYGLQHVLSMFVANITPISIVALMAKDHMSSETIGMMIQDAMFVAGIATLIQLFPLWRVGARLPIVMGISFTFVTILSTIAANYGYPTVIGAVLVGGILEGCLGLLLRRAIRFIKPIVSATVVCGIGLSLFSVGMRSFGGGYTEDFGSAENLVVGTITLTVSLLWMVLTKGPLKSLSVLVALAVGYILSICLGMVDFSAVLDGDIVSFPHFLLFKPEFHIGPILSVFVIFMVSAAETMGDTTALVRGGLGRDVKDREMSGALAADGFGSVFSALFGCPPVTSFSQNVGLINMTRVVNRFTIMTGALILVLAGFFPIIGNLLSTLPQSVLGGCTIIMFGQILLSGMKMIAECGFTQKNITVAALALGISVGSTAVTDAGFWHVFPQVVQDVFSENVVAVVFLIALLLSWILPDKME